MKKVFILLMMFQATMMLAQSPIKAVVIIDKSGSMQNFDTRPTLKDVMPLLKHVEQYGGEVAFAIIGNNSKYYLKKYRSNGQSTTPPVKKPGMTALQYRKLLLEYAENKNNSGNTGSVGAFIKSPEIQEIFNGNYGGGSDVAGAVELAEIYLSEYDSQLSNAEKHAVFVTDGQNNGLRYKAPSVFCCNMVVVHRSMNVGNLQMYNPHISTSLSQAVKTIIQ